MKNCLYRKAVLVLVGTFLLSGNSFAEQKDKSLILGDYTAKNPKEIIEQAYKNAKWDDLSIGVCQVSMTPVDGFVPMNLKNAPERLKDKTYYVSTKNVLELKDFWGLGIFYKPSFEDKIGITIFLNKDSKDGLNEYTSKHIGEFLGIVIDGELVTAPKIIVAISSGKIQVGEFEPTDAISIVKRFYKPLKSIWHYMN